MKIERFDLDKARRSVRTGREGEAWDAVARAFDAMTKRIESQQEMIDLLVEQVAEMQLRTRYVMDKMSFTRRSPILIDGVSSVKPITKTLYEIYTEGDRDRFLAALLQEAEEHARTPLRQDAGTANGGSSGTGTDDGAGGRPDASAATA